MKGRSQVSSGTLAISLLLMLVPAQAQGLLDLSAGIHRIRAEVANTGQTRAVGLMQRGYMAANDGMLFVFESAEKHCMWMRNTLIPLAVAFIDERGRIVNIEEMQPQTEDNHCATRPVKFALEMNGGWFKAKGMIAGVAISGIDKAPAAR